MPDRTFLTWPFFTDAHRRLADELEAFVRVLQLEATVRARDAAVAAADSDRQRARARREFLRAGSQVLQALTLFGPREKLVRQALDRIPPQSWPASVLHAHDIDRLIKGLHPSGRQQDPWEEMRRLTMRIAVATQAPRR